jgi:hypothetical protein
MLDDVVRTFELGVRGRMKHVMTQWTKRERLVLP